MASPIDEKSELRYAPNAERSSDEEATVYGDTRDGSRHGDIQQSAQSFLAPLETSNTKNDDASSNLQSPSQNREQAHRLDDDLHMLQVERAISAEMESEGDMKSLSKAKSSAGRSRVRHEEPVDDFDAATNPLHERTQIYTPPAQPSNKFAQFFASVHKSNWAVRYLTYITPLTLLILIPILIGFELPAAKGANVGGVEMTWFCIWLMVVWLGLWAGRVAAKCLPWPLGLVTSLFTNNSKKWRDMAKQLELPATIFFWMLAVEISFLPIMRNHEVPHADLGWTKPMNKVLITFLVAGILNFAEKIIIQLIAISFHLRTYQDRIEINKFQIGSLVKLYQFSRLKIAMEDSEFEVPSGGGGNSGTGSGAITPGQFVEKGQKATKEAFNKFGDAAGKIAGDFTGKAVKQSGHPHQVVLNLLASPGGSQVLARRLYRTFNRPETETVFSEDLTDAFDNKDEAEAAFTMFDKDMNGDISMEELEAVCVEIGRERKSITASLKDLDSVVSKLDDCFTFIVFIVVVLVFISLISTSAAGVLTSAGSAVLALSWLFSATAQEFLQSVIFVFVKHPFDVGDRVTIYGNTGSALTGDDYFVKEISLLYTEFKKLEGHVVQAPNSYLNTLFILNMRRSGGLAEAVPLILKYGTTFEQIDTLRTRLLDFVKAEKREFQANILTELRQIDECHAITVNVIFFFKSNWQNELLRLTRRNKFISALMFTMQELGMEGPRMRYPGMRAEFPVYMQHGQGHSGTPDWPMGAPAANGGQHGESMGGDGAHDSFPAYPGSRRRGESLAAKGRRMDFSLGMKNISAGDFVGDVHGDRERSQSRAAKIAINVNAASPRASSHNRDRSASTATAAARSSSISDRIRPGNLVHRGTEPVNRNSSSMHRNRFFGHRGVSHEHDRMEEGMAGIPEERSGTTSRIDPRSGLISPAAMRMTTNQSSIAGQQTTHVPSTGETARQDFGAQ